VWLNRQSASDPRQWSGWATIAGLSVEPGDAFSACRAGDGRLALIARSQGAPGDVSAHAINWETAPDSGLWSGWIAQPGGGTATGDTSVLAPLGDGSVMSFARGADGQLWTNVHTPAASWQGWTVLDGVGLLHGDRVAVAVHADGHLVIAVRDAGGQVRWREQTNAAAPATWAPWSTLTGLLVNSGDALFLVADATTISVGVRGPDGLLHYRQLRGPASGCGWSAIPGLIARPGDAFVAVLAGDGKLVAAARQGSDPTTPAPGAINWQT
jgi:hypothetical protein